MKSLLAFLFASGKLSKILLTSGTMLLSLATYAWVYGWRYATGFIALLFCHEMGHYLAARQRGLDVGAPTFIPFVGAWIQLRQLPHDVETEAYIGIAGPLVGSGAALVCYFLAGAYASPLLMALAYAGFMINLFNLIPISPLDGGRITAILSPKVWWIGAPILVGLFAWNPSPMLLLIALLAAPQLVSTLGKGQRDHPVLGYYQVPWRARVEYGLWYLGLTATLGILSFNLHNQLNPG